MRSVAQRVNISSIDLFFRRDDAGCDNEALVVGAVDAPGPVEVVAVVAAAVDAVLPAAVTAGLLNKLKPPDDVVAVAGAVVAAETFDGAGVAERPFCCSADG